MTRKVIVAGALGVVGRAVLEHLDGHSPAWGRTVGLSRRRPDWDPRGEFVSVDLRDAAGTAAALDVHLDATHLVYAALHEQPQLIAGWFDPDQIATNRQMLVNVLDVLPSLEHVTLLQGTKAYGAHLGRAIRVPAREHEPHREHANFYWEQEDLLRERSARDGFRFAIFRPQIVMGVAVGSAMNPMATLAAFALLRREQELPLVHPGHTHALAECTDARLLARAIEWAWDAPKAQDGTFNVTNGDVVAWSDLFPALADFFRMELAAPEPVRLSEAMPALAPLWEKLAIRERLRAPDLDAWIGLSWQYADALWANPRLPERPALVSTIAIRNAGFAGCIDSETSMLELLQRMRDQQYIPRR